MLDSLIFRSFLPFYNDWYNTIPNQSFYLKQYTNSVIQFSFGTKMVMNRKLQDKEWSICCQTGFSHSKHMDGQTNTGNIYHISSLLAILTFNDGLECDPEH